MSAALVRTLTHSDRECALSLWQARFFDGDAFCDWYFSERFTPALSAGVFLAGQLVSMALGRFVTLTEDGAPLTAVLVAGVSTREGYERRGYMKRAMAHVEVLAAEYGAKRLVLRPVDPAIYLPLGFLPYSAECMAFGTGRATAPISDVRDADASVFLDCYAASVSALGAYQSRTEHEMRLRLADAESDGGAYIALHDGADVIAYVLLDGKRETAFEAVARTADGYAKLLDALPDGCEAMQAPNAPLGARIPHCMAKAVGDGAPFDPLRAGARFVPEEY